MLALAVIWPGPLAALILVPIGYVLLEVRSGRATQRLRGNGLQFDHNRLVQTGEAGRELAAIDLLEPFTYEYLYKDDDFAIYQLRQHGTLLEFTSDAEAAAWVVPHVLSAEWPPVNRPARHVGF